MNGTVKSRAASRRRALATAAAAAALSAAVPACTSGSGIRTVEPQPVPAPAVAPLGARAALRQAIDSMVGTPQFRNAHWGILVVNPATGDTLYSHNAGKLFMPASNQKILTGAVAMAQLGPDYRWRTTFAARGPVRDGVLDGDLVIEGRGDPTVSDKMRGGDAMSALREIADSLRAHGVQRITGRLVRGADVFPDAIYGFGWSWDDFDAPYSAGVDELFFNEGFSRIVVRGGARSGEPAAVATLPSGVYPRVRSAVTTIGPVPAGGGLSEKERARSDANDRLLVQTDSVKLGENRVRVGRDSGTGEVVVTGYVVAGDSEVVSIAQHDPAGAYLLALGQALAERGITVGLPASPAAAATGGRRGRSTSTDASAPRRTTTAAAPSAGPARADSVLFTVLSPPLREVMPVFQKPSQNQIGEIILKTLGLERGTAGTAFGGRKVVEAQLVAWGAEPDGFAVRDGSGLSRHDYVTPETIIRVLDAMRRDSAFTVFYDALPIAGVDGTISNRMRGTPAMGNVRAKTGFVDKARSLSGYVTTADGQLLLFSMMCNNWTTSVRAVEQVQDRTAALLASMRYEEARLP